MLPELDSGLKLTRFQKFKSIDRYSNESKNKVAVKGGKKTEPLNKQQFAVQHEVHFSGGHQSAEWLN